MKRRKIKLGMEDKEKGTTFIRPIKTTIVNDVFAVHGTVYGDDRPSREDWTLTHIKTGYAVIRKGYSKAGLIRAANLLLNLSGNWDFDHPSEATQRFNPSEVMEIIRTCDVPEYF